MFVAFTIFLCQNTYSSLSLGIRNLMCVGRLHGQRLGVAPSYSQALSWLSNIKKQYENYLVVKIERYIFIETNPFYSGW